MNATGAYQRSPTSPTNSPRASNCTSSPFAEKGVKERVSFCVVGGGPMAAAHVLQVAYYDTLRELRVKMLEAAGYQVTSVSGNDNAMGLDGAVIAGANLIVVGFSAPHSVRAAMVLWFKTHYPKIPVVVLQFSSWEKFPEADVSTFSEDPTIWLTEVASILKS